MKRAAENPARLKEVGMNAMHTLPQSWDSIIDRVLDRYHILIDMKRM